MIAEDAAETSNLSPNALRAGMRLTRDICSIDGNVLLPAGKPITPQFLQLLAQRNISTIRLQSSPGACRAEPVTAEAQALEALLTDELKRAKPLRPVKNPPKSQLPIEDLLAEAQRGLDRHAAAGCLLAEMDKSLASGRAVACDRLNDFIHEFAAMSEQDCDVLATVVGLQQDKPEYLFDHCVNVALLSMAIATRLSLDTEQIRQVGIGAVLQDLGMLAVPDAVRLAPRPIDAAERAEIERHPFYTLQRLELLRDLPAVALLIAYQAHERVNGCGYPARRVMAKIHPYARIVAVADVYDALTRKRPHRPAMLPHDAIKHLLMLANKNAFDRSVLRAFLDCVSVFPIGSLVELPKGILGQVIRTNHTAHTRPVIIEIDEHGRHTNWIIDLTKHRNLQIRRAGPYVAQGQPPAPHATTAWNSADKKDPATAANMLQVNART